MAQIHTCRVLDAFRRKGLGTALHDGDMGLFRKWGVAEIQLEAVDEGFVFWTRCGFRAANPGFIAELYDEWLGEDEERDGTTSAILDQYPPEFLDSLATKFIPMYKSV
ncbi:hypothetical protein BH09MYX1_BH09MYX1_37510 [soil metagenome]